jgi:hypothetical protein
MIAEVDALRKRIADFYKAKTTRSFAEANIQTFSMKWALEITFRKWRRND